MKYLTEKETAHWLGFQPSSLKSARCTGTGDLATLPVTKMGRNIRYS